MMSSGPAQQLRLQPLSLQLPCRQQGMALIVSLIFLLLLSLLAVSSVQDATLQERMVANQRDHAMAFQAAEAALQTAEEQANRGNNITDTQWNGADAALTTTSVNDPRLSRSPRYHIWHPGGLAGQAGEGDDDNNPYPIYQINAVGYGGSPNSRVVLQSWYIPDN